MNENEKILCEKCGKEMLPLDTQRSIGMICPSCGWGWATSYFEPYETDQTEYSIIVFGNNATKNNIKIIAEYANINYIQAKKLIEMPEAIVLVGKAAEILEKKKKLIENNISFKIQPEFPY